MKKNMQSTYLPVFNYRIEHADEVNYWYFDHKYINRHHAVAFVEGHDGSINIAWDKSYMNHELKSYVENLVGALSIYQKSHITMHLITYLRRSLGPQGYRFKKYGAD